MTLNAVRSTLCTGRHGALKPRRSELREYRRRSNEFVVADEQNMEIRGRSFGAGPFFSMYAEHRRSNQLIAKMKGDGRSVRMPKRARKRVSTRGGAV